MLQHRFISRFAAALCLGAVTAPASAGFLIDTSVTSAQTLSSGTVMITTTGLLTVAGTTAAVNLTGSATLDNYGTVTQTGTGRALDNNNGSPTLTVFNRAGASIIAADADTFRVNRANTSVTLDNAGLMRSLNPSGGGNQVIDWNAITGGANRLDNRATGVIEAHAADAVRPGTQGVVNNAGVIRALPVIQGSAPNRTPSGSDGIDTQTRSGVQVTNTGTISGRHGITGGNDSNPITITIDNGVTGTILGVNGSGINIDGSGSFARIYNRGLIEGRFDAAVYDSGDGDGVDVDGRVELDNWGIMRGINASPGNNPEGVSIGGGIVRNHAGAEISGDNRLGNGTLGNGLLVDNSDGGPAFAATTLINAGLIRGHQGFAVKLIGDFDDVIDNQAGGILRGAGAQAAVQTGGGDDRVRNAGAIIGDDGNALDLGAGDDTLIISGGAAHIQGAISGGSGIDQMILELGADNTFAYTGTVTAIEHILLASGRAELSGMLDGALTVASGATLGVGQLDVRALVLHPGALLAIDLDPHNLGSTGLVRVGETVDLGLAELTLRLLALPTPGATFTVVSHTGAEPISGRFAQGGRIAGSFAGRDYWFAIDYGQEVRLTALASTVPLPASVWLLVAGLLGLGLASAGRR